jgi:hypothetical protein
MIKITNQNTEIDRPVDIQENLPMLMRIGIVQIHRKEVNHQDHKPDNDIRNVVKKDIEPFDRHAIDIYAV